MLGVQGTELSAPTHKLPFPNLKPTYVPMRRRSLQCFKLKMGTIKMQAERLRALFG